MRSSRDENEKTKPNPNLSNVLIRSVKAEQGFRHPDPLPSTLLPSLPLPSSVLNGGLHDDLSQNPDAICLILWRLTHFIIIERSLLLMLKVYLPNPPVFRSVATFRAVFLDWLINTHRSSTNTVRKLSSNCSHTEDRCAVLALHSFLQNDQTSLLLTGLLRHLVFRVSHPPS